MRKFLAATLLGVAGAAGAQTTWSTSQFTVSTDNDTKVAISGGTVDVSFLPSAISNPGANSIFPPVFFDLDFAPQPGYVLLGETVSFTVNMNVDAYNAPSNLLIKAVGGFNVDVNGTWSIGNTNDGGITHDAGMHFFSSPNLVAEIDESATEGIACPVGHEANGCNFGIDFVFLGAFVNLASFTVTPVLSAVPEPGTAALWLAGVGLLASSTRRRRPG